MAHDLHRPGYEEQAILDPECSQCQDAIVGDLDDAYMHALVGMTREQFDDLTDPSRHSPLVVLAAEMDDDQATAGDRATLRMAQALLWAFRYQMRRASALKVAVEVGELARRKRWPLRPEPISPWRPGAGAGDQQDPVAAAGLEPETI